MSFVIPYTSLIILTRTSRFVPRLNDVCSRMYALQHSGQQVAPYTWYTPSFESYVLGMGTMRLQFVITSQQCQHDIPGVFMRLGRECHVRPCSNFNRPPWLFISRIVDVSFAKNRSVLPYTLLRIIRLTAIGRRRRFDFDAFHAGSKK